MAAVIGKTFKTVAKASLSKEEKKEIAKKVAASTKKKKSKGRPKVDKRKSKGIKRTQSKARQAQFQQREATKAEAQGTTKTKLAEKRNVERKTKIIRGKNIDGRTKTLAIRLVQDNPKLTANQAIKKAKSESQARMPQIKSRARSETAKLRAKGAFKGFTEEQMKERRNLIASSLREMAAEGKERKVIAGRTLSLTPAGEKIIKQKGGIDKILEKPKTYLYQTMNESLPPKGSLAKYEGATKAETRKNIRAAFEEMSKSQKLEFIQKRFAPDLVPKQIEDIFFSPTSKPNLDISRTKIEGIRNRLKDKGLLPALGEVKTVKAKGTKQGQALVKEIRKIKKQAENIRTKDIPKVETQIDRAQDAMKRAKTTEVKNKLRDEISKLKKEKERLTNLANNYEKGKVTKAKKTLSKMPPQTGSIQSTYTSKKSGGKIGTYKKGKQIKSGPRGCGAALRGYGKAMKGKK